MPRIEVEQAAWEEAVWEFVDGFPTLDAYVWWDLGPCMGTVPGAMELRPVLVVKEPA